MTTDHDMERLNAETITVVGGRGPREPGEPLTTPVMFASSFHAGGAIEYARDGNPTWSAFEEVLGTLEGGTALAFASGMAAIAAILEGLPVGATVVAPTAAYMGTRMLIADRAQLGRFVLRTVDIVDTERTIALCDGADLLWLESPTNPLMGIADLRTLIDAAHSRGVTVVVDNTFATPLLQRPLDLGADLVVHSVTKYLSGHADLLMGATITRDERWQHDLLHRRELYGGVVGPMEAYLALRGIRTLGVRLERAQQSAGILAERLSLHPSVTRVRYPGLPDDPGHAIAKQQMCGFGGMLSFEVDGGAQDADRVAESVRVITYATSLGGVESLIERRNRWPGEENTPASLLRLSVGIEHVEDLWADLEQALAR